MAHGGQSRLGGSMEGRSTRPPLVRRGLAWGLSSVGEHLLCKQGVTGSNPVASTNLRMMLRSCRERRGWLSSILLRTGTGAVTVGFSMTAVKLRA